MDTTALAAARQPSAAEFPGRPSCFASRCRPWVPGSRVVPLAGLGRTGAQIVWALVRVGVSWSQGTRPRSPLRRYTVRDGVGAVERRRIDKGDTMARSFVFNQWALVDPPDIWQFAAGSFTGQSRSELFGYARAMAPCGSARTPEPVAFQPWATVDPVDGWQFTAGDFTGNGRADVMGYHPAMDRVDGRELRCTFAFSRARSIRSMAGSSPRATSQVTQRAICSAITRATDHCGSARTPERLRLPTLGHRRARAGWLFVADDFTGNGRTDVMGYHPATGSLWVGENTGTGFALSPWASVDPAGLAVQPRPLHRTSQVRSVRLPPRQRNTVGRRELRDDFSFQQWGTVDPVDGWRFVSRVFNADLWTDIVGYRPSNGSVWVGESTLRPSRVLLATVGLAGRTIQFMVSGDGASQAVIQRCTSMSSAVDSVDVMTLDFAAAPSPFLPRRAIRLRMERDLFADDPGLVDIRRVRGLVYR